MKRALFVPTVIAVCLTSVLAQAEEDSKSDSDSKRKMFSAGVQTLLGASLYTKPDNVNTINFPVGNGFVGSAGGFSWGMGAYGEFRPLKYLGLSLGLGYDKISFHRNITYNGLVKLTETATASNMRIGFLLKGIAPTPFGRAWLGLGPEFLVPTSADANVKVTSGPSILLPAISAKQAASTLFSFGLGFVFNAGPLEIPVDVRASTNLSQKANHADRVSGNAANYQVTARTDWDFRLRLGLGYRF